MKYDPETGRLMPDTIQERRRLQQLGMLDPPEEERLTAEDKIGLALIGASVGLLAIAFVAF